MHQGLFQVRISSLFSLDRKIVMQAQQEQLVDVHFISEARLRELGAVSELPEYRTMVRAIEPRDIERHREEIEALLRAFGRQRQYFIDLLFRRQNRALCRGTEWRTIRNNYVAAQYQSDFGLQARHWKMALQASSATMSNYWRLAQTRALDKIRRKPWFAKLNRLEKSYVNRVLSSLSDDFFTVLEGRTPRVVEDAAHEKIESRKGLSHAVRRTVRQVMGRRPRHGDDVSVWFDSSCYSTKPCGGNVMVSLMSLKPGRRITLTIKGSVPVNSTIRLVKKSDGRIDLHVQKKLTRKDVKPIGGARSPQGRLTCRAFDLGFTEVAFDDEGRRFGVDFGTRLSRYAEYLDDVVQKRNTLQEIAKASGKGKRRRMLRCNLGERKFERNKTRMRAAIKQTVNEALNRMLERSPAQVYVLENLTHRFVFDKKISKEMRSKLSKWTRGTIRQRVLFKTACAGVQVVFVPAAYSSQHCPRCGYTERKNRKGNVFHCKTCGYTAHADQNGAWNLLMRARDPAYKRFMSKDEVRRLEQERHEAWLKRRSKELSSKEA